jgi:hypothetical protein
MLLARQVIYHLSHSPSAQLCLDKKKTKEDKFPVFLVCQYCGISVKCSLTFLSLVDLIADFLVFSFVLIP